MMEKKRSIGLITLILSLCFLTPSFAETIILKSGEKVEAKIIERTDGYIIIDFYGTPVTYQAYEIESVDGIKAALPKSKKIKMEKERLDNLLSEPVPVEVNEIPDNAEIVYFHEGYVYVMDREGSNVEQITFGERFFYEHVAVSHDKRYIAGNAHFPIDKPIFTKVIVFDTKEKKRWYVLPDFFDTGNGGVDFDHQGFLYFVGSTQREGIDNIYKMKPDGTSFTRLTLIERDINATPPIVGFMGDVSVSPDGSLVAFVFHAAEQTDAPIKNGPIERFTIRDNWYVKAKIYVMNSDGTNMREVYDGGEHIGVHGQNNQIGAYDPEISPDNTKVTFSITNIEHENLPFENTAHDIWIIDIDGDPSTLRKITQPGPISLIPDWKEDRIVFWEVDGDDNFIGASIINTDGTGYKRINTGAHSPKWIPSHRF